MITTMNQNSVHAQKEWNILEKYIKFFASKTIQAVVQSRTAVMRKSHSKTNSTSYDWFNVAVEDEPSIRKMANDALAHQRLVSAFSMCIEIQLKTVDGSSLVLETWCLTMKEQQDPNARLACVYPRMSVLLKSIISVSRVSPAYKLAICQTNDSYRLLYKIYFGEPHVDILGEDSQEHKIGQVITPVGILSMSLAYRVKMTITPPKIDKGNAFMVKSDYFKPDMSPKLLRPSTVNGFHSELDHLNKETYHSLALIPNGATDCLALTPNGTTDCVANVKKRISLSDIGSNEDYRSICSNGVTENFKIAGAFASSKFPDPSSFPDIILPEKTIINLAASSLGSSGEKRLQESEQSKTPDKNANLNVAIPDDNSKSLPSGDVDYNCNASCGTMKMNGSASLECEDFVMVDLRPPFADSDSGSDLCAFFRECKCAPPLASFASQPTLEEQVSDITNQLAQFETSMVDFDTFVDTLCQTDSQK